MSYLRKTDPLRISSKQVIAIWSGYDSIYVKNIVSGGIKALKLLATLTFDAALLMWVKGLENHLNKRIREAEEERKRVEKLKFK